MDNIFRMCYIAVEGDTAMVGIRIHHLLKNHGRTFYWLAKETGISHTTLWRLKKGRALGINFVTLEKLCQALNCQPGDLLSLTNEKKQRAKKSRHTRSKSA